MKVDNETLERMNLRMEFYLETKTKANDDKIKYIDWLEKRLVKKLNLQNVSQQRELLLSAICQFTKRNTQKDIQEVEKWIENDFRK